MQSIDRKNLHILRQIVAKEGKATVRLYGFDRAKAGFDPIYDVEEIRWLKGAKLVCFRNITGEHTADGFSEEHAIIEATPEGHALVEERQKESVETFWHKTYPAVLSTLALLVSVLAFLYARGFLR